MTDARGNTHTYTFATQFNVIKPTALSGTPLPSLGGKAFSYDANGFIASRTDYDGNVTTFAHDARGDETSRVEAAGTALARTVSTSWLATFHLPAQITEPNRSVAFTYDAHGNALTTKITKTPDSISLPRRGGRKAASCATRHGSPSARRVRTSRRSLGKR